MKFIFQYGETAGKHTKITCQAVKINKSKGVEDVMNGEKHVAILHRLVIETFTIRPQSEQRTKEQRRKSCEY